MRSTNPFRRFLHRLALELEGDLDRLQTMVRGEPSGDKLRMLAFAGYRNATELRVKGRMVRFAEPLTAGSDTWYRIKAMLAIYNSHEVAGVAVRCETDGDVFEALSDDEGYFDFVIPIAKPLLPSTR